MAGRGQTVRSIRPARSGEPAADAGKTAAIVVVERVYALPSSASIELQRRPQHMSRRRSDRHSATCDPMLTRPARTNPVGPSDVRMTACPAPTNSPTVTSANAPGRPVTTCQLTGPERTASRSIMDGHQQAVGSGSGKQRSSGSHIRAWPAGTDRSASAGFIIRKLTSGRSRAGVAFAGRADRQNTEQRSVCHVVWAVPREAT
jgi:hypothetical protein